ncbi:MAG: hypothetical protein JAY85_09145 [Candidatus Thiodiazotropha weberae]|uniref:hypothetical protein n=1 Tax=Candidatus Thiodiazotropha endoloripes TaxID=1818881 RepID=UPI0013900C62|nr:hypothetical protein [Candidatus Thiodiazotropha endoloripes]MCG7898609.1 hypothetical protein [Candidatus Thiodiazotropha weberae]MCG7912420.1 hypothetical protein [Candidatus Thiodiazotropha weberae]
MAHKKEKISVITASYAYQPDTEPKPANCCTTTTAFDSDSIRICLFQSKFKPTFNPLSDKPEITLKPKELLSVRKLEIPRVEEAQVASLPLNHNCICGVRLIVPATELMRIRSKGNSNN